MDRVFSPSRLPPVSAKVQGTWVQFSFPYHTGLIALAKEAQSRWDPSAKVWVLPLFLWPRFRRALPEGAVVVGEAEANEARRTLWEEAKVRIQRADGLLLPEQAVDLRGALEAFLASATREGPKGFLLANGTGTGKTYVYAAFASVVRAVGLEVVVVVPNEDIARQSQGVLTLFGAQEGVLLTTYGKLDPEWARGKVLVLDEAHLAKRAFASDRGKKAWLSVLRSVFTLFVTATPFDRPWEAQYLLEPSEFVRHLGEESFEALMRRFRVYTREGFNGSREFYFAGGVEDLAAFHNLLRERNFMSKRLYRPPEGMVEHEVPFVDIPKGEKAFLAEVRRRLKEAARQALPEERGLVLAHRTFLSRAILERYKLKAAFPMVEKLLAEGWHVLLFVHYREEKVMDLSTPEAVEALAEEVEAKGLKGVLHRYLLTALEGLEFRLPSPAEMVASHFAHLGEALGYYTGAQTEARLRETKRRWDEGEIRLLLATAAKGGTGLSFHDLTGRRPTAQVVLTLPWTATQLDQILGRVVRVGMRSPVRILLPAAPVPFERKLAQTIASSLHTLGYAVRGGEGVVPDRVVQAFLHDLANVDPEGFQRLLEEEEWGRGLFSRGKEGEGE